MWNNSLQNDIHIKYHTSTIRIENELGKIESR